MTMQPPPPPQGRPPPQGPQEPIGSGAFFVLAILAILLGVPFLIAGVAMLFTIVLIPVGLLFILLSGAPLAGLSMARSQQMQDWRRRDHALPSDQPKPWYMEDDDDDYPYGG